MTSLRTCAVLWASRQPERLSARVRSLLLDSREELVLSVVSAWEIALKPELGITDVARWFRQAARNLHARILPHRTTGAGASIRSTQLRLFARAVRPEGVSA